MKAIIKYIAAVFLITTFFACERVIDLDLPTGEPLPYIDAWITTNPGVQVIKFLEATGYQSTQQPEPIPGASVTVTDMTTGTDYAFAYQNGAYYHDPGSSASIGVVGHRYRLRIVYNGETFEAFDEIKRVTAIDSITYEFREEKESDEKEGYYAKFYARDLPGATDYYWIRTYRNNTLNYYVGEMLSIDGTFSSGVNDGFAFIPPFREGITSGEKPYLKGDTVKVLMRSLTENSYDFMNLAVEQLNNEGLFAQVLKNVPANMQNQQPGSSVKIYGWFGTVAETDMVTVIR